MSTLRGRKYTMLSDISLARRKISNVPSVKDENCMFKKRNFQIEQPGCVNCRVPEIKFTFQGLTVGTVLQYQALGGDCCCDVAL